MTGLPIRGRFANELPSRRLCLSDRLRQQRHASTSFTNFPQAESRGIEPLAQGLPWFSFCSCRPFSGALHNWRERKELNLHSMATPRYANGFVDRCVHPVTPRSQRRRAVESNHNCSSICLANSAEAQARRSCSPDRFTLHNW